MSVCRKKWEVIALAKESHKIDNAVFEMPNIENSIIYRTKAFG